MLDNEIGLEHVSPTGLNHHAQRKDGKWYASIKMRHFVIKAHQDAFPELKEQMAKAPENATNIYSAFLALSLLKLKGQLTKELKDAIIKTYKIY